MKQVAFFFFALPRYKRRGGREEKTIRLLISDKTSKVCSFCFLFRLSLGQETVTSRMPANDPGALLAHKYILVNGFDTQAVYIRLCLEVIHLWKYCDRI